MTKTTRTKDNSCPCCHANIDACSSIEGEQIPEEGDVSICAYCGTILEFAKELTLQIATNDTLRELPEDMMVHLLKIQKVIESRLLAKVTLQ
jgi:hypothetical protein